MPRGALVARARRRLNKTLAAQRLWWRRLTRPTVITLGGVKLKMTPAMSPLVRQVLYAGEYEAAELEALRKFLSR
ncbi:MAG: hypothetical protein LC737_07675, partial [Chloroflexi bacterium]|nr:hypothetical protein [Chloroflexota bacterium]